MGEDNIHGVNYLDDLLNEMTKESEEEDSKKPTPATFGPSSRRDGARPESFRGDFDYLEALLNDIGPPETTEPTHTQAAATPPAHRRPPSIAPRATNTAAFDLESTLKDLEDTFYNGLEGGNLKRTTSVISWPKDNQQDREDYMDVLDELVNMNMDSGGKGKKDTEKRKPPEDASVLDQMIDSFEEKKEKKPKGVQVLPTSPTPASSYGGKPSSKQVDDDDVSYLDQMLSSFIGPDTTETTATPAHRKQTKLGVQVLPSGPTHSPTLKQVERLIASEVPRATKDPSCAYIFPRSRSSICPPDYPAPVEPLRGMARAPAPAAASTPAPAKIPALRTTNTFTPPPRATINMDDLLDQVINSIVKEESSSVTTSATAKQPRQSTSTNPTSTKPAPPSTEDDDVMSQILSNQELNMAKLERKVQGSTARDWMIPLSEFEPMLKAKLGVGNHGEAYRPGVWRGTRVVVKRWNTSLSLSFPLQEEITTLVSLTHPNLVPVLGACGDGKGLYTISEYVNGANLHGFLHNGGLSGEKDSTVTILRIALQIAQAMTHLHSHGISHRSLAPKNVLLDNQLNAHVRDYGLAALKDDIWTTQRAANPRFPLYDSQYVAPELLRGAQYTMQVDVYSFGVLLWEAFAGESAHDGLVLRDLHGCPFAVQKLIKLCVSTSPPARPTFSTVVKILSQPMDTLLKYARPTSALDSGFFKPDHGSQSRPSSFMQPFSQPPSRPQSEYFETPAERIVDEEEEDKKLKKVLYAIMDLIRTPSDHAQLKAINAIESLAQKTWNVTRMIANGFVPNIVDLLHSKFVDVQETSARVVASMLKNTDFCQTFVRCNGIGALFDLLAGPDDGVRLVAAKALTVAAYTTPDLTRSDAHTRGGGAALAALLRVDNEFVRVQTAWALNQLLVPGHPLLDAFYAADGVPLISSLLITGGSPAAELRALGALLPLLASPHTRKAIPSSVPRKIALLLSSPQPPLRAQALQAAALLAADKATVPILLEGHGLSVALLAIIQPPLNNPLILQALDLLRSIAETPAHAAILVRVGLREALHPHLASVDSNVLKAANVLYNLLV